ncbi:uncharacterized protein BDV14DRAFT_203311 [Aspergillus stella-maris]|uniref:uncharacterized protein n=1 Tax=Aspergillus stella-maris TaxID=1810926 RepID=UPI003CCCC606
MSTPTSTPNPNPPSSTSPSNSVGGRARKFRSFLCKRSEDQRPELTAESDRDLCRLCSIYHHYCSTRVKEKRSANPDTNWIVNPAPLPEELAGLRVMAMMRCCKRVYTEVIGILYKENTFYIENPRTLLELPKYIPQEHLSLIKNLTLESPTHRIENRHATPDRLARWKEVIAALKRMDNLTSLTIILRPYFGLIDEREDLIGPIREVQGELSTKPKIIWDRVVHRVPAVSDKEFCDMHKPKFRPARMYEDWESPRPLSDEDDPDL